MTKLIVTTKLELETNDGFNSEKDTQLYMQNYVAEALKDWDKASMVVEQTNADGEQMHHSFSQVSSKADDKSKSKRSRYPWHCSADDLPTKDEYHVLICEWDDEQQIWLNFKKCIFDSTKKTFTMYEGEVAKEVNPSPFVYWRLVNKPDFTPTK